MLFFGASGMGDDLVVILITSTAALYLCPVKKRR